MKSNKILANYPSPPGMTPVDVSELSYYQESDCKDDGDDNVMLQTIPYI